MTELNPELEFLARGMLEENMIIFGGDFVLSDGSRSSTYVDMRDMISMPFLFGAATTAYVDAIQESGILIKPDSDTRHLLAIPEAAVYYGGAVGLELAAPMLYLRVENKGHGRPQAIQGRYSIGDEVVLLDDVVTTAGEKIKKAAALSELGLKTTGVVVLVDREQGGRTALRSLGLEFASAMTLSGIAQYALDEHLAGVTQTLHDDLLAELDPVELGIS